MTAQTTTQTSRLRSVNPANGPAHAPRRRLSGQQLLLGLLAAIVGTLFLLPAVWMLFGSLRPGAEVIGSVSPLSWNTLIPNIWTLDNYAALFGQLGFGQAMMNSLIVAFASVALGLVITIPAAYALSVFQFPGREVIFAVLVVGFMIPFEAIAIPLAQIFTEWNLNNTYIALILPGIGNGLAIFNLRQFFLGIPGELREAARVDGASEVRTMTQIYLPLSVTPVINSALLIFLMQWSAYLWPLLIVSDEKVQVAAIALSRTFTDTTFNFGQMFGGALVISVIPALLLLFLQRYFSQSVATKGLK